MQVPSGRRIFEMKGLDAKKMAKKKPLRSADEKRAAKRAKRSAGSGFLP